LLAEEIAGLLPDELVGVLLVDGAIVLPAAGTQSVMAVAEQSANMFGRAGAPVGHEQEAIGKCKQLRRIGTAL